jgi:predicted dehydrogenase
LHLCEIRPDRLAEVKALYKPATATPNYQDIIGNPNISVVYISTTPESNHYPICRDCLKSGKNVMRDTPVMVTPESARRVMETYSAADLSADRNEPVDLPLTNETIAAIADFKQKIRAGVND